MKTPITIHEWPTGLQSLIDADSTVIGEICQPRARDNAAFIERACNAHADLVGILTGILEVLDHNDPWTKASRNNLAKSIRNALEKAGAL